MAGRLEGKVALVADKPDVKIRHPIDSDDQVE